MSTNSKSSSGRSPSQSKDVTTSSSTSTKTPITQTIRESLYASYKNGQNNSTSNTNNQSGRSPVSPSRITRLQEKEEMQNLNDRLVIYIDTVRRLESENNRLQSIVLSYNENSNRDVNEIKKLYENELDDAKLLIDELAKEKAKYEIQVNKLIADAEETAAKLTKKEREFKNLETKFKTCEAEAIEFKARYESLQAECSHDREELKQLRPHAADLEQQLKRLKKQLEDETLQRVDLENKNQTLKEDLTFKAQLYGKEIDQLRSSKRVEIEQVDVRLRDEYDSRLVSELQRIRDETEFKILEMKEEVERRYLSKHNEVESNLKRSQQVQASLKEELSGYKSLVEELQTEIKSLQTKLAFNDTKIKDLEDKLRKSNLKYEKDIADKDLEVDKVRKEISDLLLEYQELYDIKIALDMEIAAYRKLLESEEQRLNISSSIHQTSHLGASFLGSDPISSTAAGASTLTTRSGKKRKMANTFEADESVIVSSVGQSVDVKQSHKTECGIEIGEHDFEGKCVRLINTTDKEMPIGGWLLRRNADNQLTEYKFNKSTVIKPGQQITVWSSNSGASHEPPNDILMNSLRWFVGDSMITILVDKDANVS